MECNMKEWLPLSHTDVVEFHLMQINIYCLVLIDFAADSITYKGVLDNVNQSFQLHYIYFQSTSEAERNFVTAG